MYIWDVTLGTMRRTLQERGDGRAVAAVFDAESTRLAEASRSGAIQVSDVQITSRKLRRLATVHGLIGFLFNAVIIALTVNIAASLMG